jgi:hypothetical protein
LLLRRDDCFYAAGLGHLAEDCAPDFEWVTSSTVRILTLCERFLTRDVCHASAAVYLGF